MDRILQQLSDYALGLVYDDLPQEVVDRAKHIVLDTVGCALGAAKSLPAVIARAVASEVTSATLPPRSWSAGKRPLPTWRPLRTG